MSRNDEPTLISWTTILSHKALVVMCSWCKIQMLGHDLLVCLISFFTSQSTLFQLRRDGCLAMSYVL